MPTFGELAALRSLLDKATEFRFPNRTEYRDDRTFDILVRRHYGDVWLVEQSGAFWARVGDWVQPGDYKWLDDEAKQWVRFTRDEAVAVAEWLVSRRAQASHVPVGTDPSGVGVDTWGEFAAACGIETVVPGV